MTKLKIGDTLYIQEIHQFLRREANIHKSKITKINTVSIYVEYEENGFEVRLDKRKLLSHKYGTTYKAYLTEDEFWEKERIKEERENLILAIQSQVPKLSLEDLQKIDEIIGRS